MSKTRNKALTMDAIMELLEELSDEENDFEQADIVVIPPDVHYISDHDEANDDECGEAFINDVPGPLELHLAQDQIENEEVRERNFPQEKPQNATKKRKLCSSEPIWRKKQPEYKNCSDRTKSYDDSLKK